MSGSASDWHGVLTPAGNTFFYNTKLQMLTDNVTEDTQALAIVTPSQVGLFDVDCPAHRGAITSDGRVR